MTKGEIRAAEYRARAEQARASAEGASLERIRELHDRSAATWTQMADAEEARARSLRGPPPAAAG